MNFIRILIYYLFVKPLVTIAFGLAIQGRRHLESTEQFIIVSNHNSHLDTLFLLSLFKPGRLAEIRPVAAADYFERNAFILKLCRLLFNILPVHRKSDKGGPNAMDVMRETLNRGQSLILFPEGTRGKPEKLSRIRKGAAYIIKEFPDIRVIMVAMTGLGRSMPKGAWYPVPLICKMHIEELESKTSNTKQITTEIESFFRSVTDSDKQKDS